MIASGRVLSTEGIGRFVGDRYHVVRELGRGGMGVVYLGRDLRREMDVAIKVRGVTHQSATLWLKREFRAVATLRHPNLVELYELVAHEDSCYFTMEYLPGIDPRRWVERDPELFRSAEPSDQTTRTALPIQAAHTEVSLTPRTAAPLLRGVPLVDFGRVRVVLAQLAEGLAFLHARGVIHRDVKPSNAIVTEGAVKLLDFGLALEQRRAEHELSRETRVVGTAAYLAPAPEPDLVSDLDEALTSLSDDHHLVLVLCDLQGLTSIEAAAVLGRTPAATKSLHGRARRALKAALETLEKEDV